MRRIILNGNKKPLCTGWNIPHHDCVKLECKHEDHRMWGIALNGTTVFDIDSQEALEFFQTWLEYYSGRTMIVKTPGKGTTPGFHVYFDGEIKPFAVGTSPRHLDVKSGTGHMVVAANQMRDDGGYYTLHGVCTTRLPVDDQVLFADSVREFRSKYATNTQELSDYNDKQLYYGVNSGRNDMFFKLTSSLRHYGIPHDVIDALCRHLYGSPEFMDTAEFPPEELELILKRSRQRRDNAQS